MFSRYSNYNNLSSGAVDAVASSTTTTGSSRRFGRDVTNSRVNVNSNAMNAGKSMRGMPGAIEKKVSHKYLEHPKIHENHPVNEQSRTTNPLLPVTNLLPSSKQQPQQLKKPAKTLSSSVSRSNASGYQYTGKVDDIDERCKDDPLCTTDYVQDMYDLYRQKEQLTAVLPVYMESTQPHINESMRSILVDWLIEVHMKFRLVPETLYLTINLIDRFLERQEISRPRLQLLGVSCLLIASKYEEIYPPQVHELVYICDSAYSRDNIMDMETNILKTLEYRITQPSAHTFLVRYLKAAHADKQMTQLACYLLDGTLQSYNLLHRLPSELAAASVFLARHTTGRNPWSPTLLKYAAYKQEDIAPIAREILEEKSAASPDLRSVNKKYSSSKYGNVANKPLSCDF